ncbi:MAG TPA: lysozyme inhibitor LprI family protein [Rhizomicrobium sp.]|jgi:uncharacterized protein YecT (DUF1311 family)
MLGLALAAMLVNSNVQQMMPAGPSPDSGFAGTWRVIAAAPAPWASRKTLTKADTPLLEYAVEFRDGVAKGPPALACDHAQYSSGQTYLDGLFGGKIKGNTAADAKLHLTNPPSTFWTICGANHREYYIDDNADLLMADGDVIYTLQRPTGMDTEQYTPGFSGPSIDCAKAKSAADHLICTDASLAKADREMSAAYARLKSSETPESFATVQASQRAWLGYVIKSCKAGGKLPDDQGAQNDLQQCLSDNYTDRAERLGHVKVMKVRALTLEPRMRFFSRAKPATEDSDIYPWVVGDNAFNAWAAKSLALDGRRMDDKNLFAFTADQVGDLKLYARRTYNVVRFDDRVASFQTYTYDYTGGAHEVLGERQFNWDMHAAKPIAPADVFMKDWKKAITDYCVADLAKQFREAGNDAPKRADVAGVVDSGAFLFGPKALRVHFTVYTITSFAGGEYDVDIPYTVLKPYLKSDAPVL